MRWTADQAKVITSRNKNLLVAAAAGSGKTTVLVERVMQLVEEGANIDEMLIVTFTRAASNDMREKFRKRFREIAQMGVPHAQEQLERLENASISTLHAFCTDVLRYHFEAAGVDPMFRIIDDAEDKQLTERALDEALENAYLEGGDLAVITNGSIRIFDKNLKELKAQRFYESTVTAFNVSKNGAVAVVSSGSIKTVYAFDANGNLVYDKNIGENIRKADIIGESLFLQTASGVIRINVDNKTRQFLSSSQGSMLVYNENTAIVCGEAKAEYLVFE